MRVSVDGLDTMIEGEVTDGEHRRASGLVIRSRGCAKSLSS